MDALNPQHLRTFDHTHRGTTGHKRAGRIDFRARFKRLVTGLITIGLLAANGLATAAPPAGKGNGNGGGGTLTAPSSLSAATASSSQININWTDPNSGENGFEIQRSPSASGTFVLIGTVNKNTSSYNNTGLSSGTQYCYRVRATGRKGTVSAYSNTSCATTSSAGDTTAPTVSITSPSSGSTYTSAQIVTLNASASDNVGVTQVRFYDGSTWKGTASSAPYSYNWSISEALNGSHSWTARAYDAAGNLKVSSAVGLTVNITPADTTAPTVSITSPSSGSTYTSAQIVTLNASASDNVGVTQVRFYDGSTWKGTDSSAPYSYGWSVSEALNGSHSWTARAYDAAGNLKVSSAVGLTVNITPADTTAPTVSITSPSSGSTYTSAQTVTLNASASDNVGVTQVRFYDGSTWKGTDSSAPYSYGWSVSEALNGSHSWTARAYDAAGNLKVSSAVGLTVNITPADTTAPTVSITSPSSGSTYTSAQTVTLNASASDNVGVTQVRFYDGSTWKGTDSSAPYSYGWSVSEALNGSHSWTARAYDAAGNLKVSSAVGLTVNITAADTTAPTVSITSPSSGSTYSSAQTVTLNASASDNVGVTQVRFYDGSTWKGTDSSAPYRYNWSVSEADNGSHSWTARAYDAAGNLKTSSAVGLNVNITASDTTAPTVSITSPSSGSSYSSAQTVTINASASDNVGVTQVRFYDGSTWKGTDSSSPYRYNWSVSEADNGSHSWTARAYDAAGNLKTSSAVSLTVDISTSTGSAGDHIWSLDLGGPSWTDEAISKAVATDNNGSAMIAGDFTDTIDLGGDTLTSIGSSDIFLAKYLSDGTLNWSRRFGGSTTDVLLGGDMNGAGDMVVVGYFSGTAEFGGASFTSAGATDVFVAKYAANGAHLWSKRLGSTTNDRAYAVAIADNGDIAVTGYFSGTVDFGGGPRTSVGAADTFVAKYAANGSHLWSVRGGGSSSDIGTAIAIDEASGEVVVSGYYSGSANFGGSTLTSAGGNDIFAAKYSANGAHRWSKRFGDTSDDRGWGVAIDQTGYVILTGYFYGAANFGGGILTSAGSSDLFLAKYAPDGVHQWSTRMGADDPSYGDNVNGICVDLSGNITITGIVHDSVDFGGGVLWGNGTSDTFIANFGPNGSHRWSIRAGDSFTDSGMAVAADLDGHVLATGTFYTSADFGGGNLTSPGGISGYLVKFSP